MTFETVLNKILRVFHHKAWKWLPEYSAMTQRQLIQMYFTNHHEFWGIVKICSVHMLMDKLEVLEQKFLEHEPMCKRPQSCRLESLKLHNLVEVYNNFDDDKNTFDVVYSYVKKYNKWFDAHAARNEPRMSY